MNTPAERLDALVRVVERRSAQLSAATTAGDFARAERIELTMYAEVLEHLSDQRGCSPAALQQLGLCARTLATAALRARKLGYGAPDAG